MVSDNALLVRFIMPSPVRFGQLRSFVESHGWKLVRVSGSHHIFKKPDGTSYSVPVHKNLVKPFYVREIKKIIEIKGG